MSTPAERTVTTAAGACRVWSAGHGHPVVFLPGLAGAPRWCAFMDAAARGCDLRVVSPPGFDGSTGHESMDGIEDWVIALLDVLDAAAPETCTLAGESVGAMLAAELAAFAPRRFDRLVLFSPLGLFDAADPVADVFAQHAAELPKLLCENTAALQRLHAAPDGIDATEWMILRTRVMEAAARLLWPLGDRGLSKRLHRLRMPVDLVVGAGDRVLPASYVERFQRGVSGATRVTIVERAGHLVTVDAPERCAGAVVSTGE